MIKKTIVQIRESDFRKMIDGEEVPVNLIKDWCYKRPDEDHTAFTIRLIKAEVWREGYTAGRSRAMREMSDEPDVAPAKNPYADRSSND